MFKNIKTLQKDCICIFLQGFSVKACSIILSAEQGQFAENNAKQHAILPLHREKGAKDGTLLHEKHRNVPRRAAGHFAGNGGADMSVNKFFIEKLLYPAMEHGKGNRIRTYLREMKQTQYADSEALHTLRETRLKQLLRACATGVPAYQRLGITDEDIEKDPWAVFRAIPILKKSAFQNEPQRFLNTQYDRARLIPNVTGGSTGEPVKFFMDRYTVEHYEAARWRGLSWWGITPGSRSVMIWGNPIELSQEQQRSARWKDRLLKNRTVISAYDLTEEEVTQYVRFLNHYQPEYLYGYASALETFAHLLRPIREKLHLKHLKVVVSTSETLDDSRRQSICDTFGCPVLNEYGARDAGILGYECRCGHLHIMAENCILEVVDPVTLEPVAPGESGLVVTTDLNNLAMPRLRYLLGDTATLSPAAGCPCGVTLPTIQSLDGREDAIFELPDGKLVHGNFVNQLSRKYQTIRQFQLIQTSVAHAELRVVMSEQGLLEEVETFRRDVAGFMPGVEVQAIVVPHIEPSKSGKFRYSIRQFDRSI